MYDHQIQQYYSLVSKRVTSEVEKRPEELQSSEEFRGLVDRVESLEDEPEMVHDNFEDRDFKTMFSDV